MRAWQKTRTSSGRSHLVQRKDDPGMLLQTLKDAARFIGLMEPWRQARAYWHRCAGEILKAAKTGKRRTSSRRRAPSKMRCASKIGCDLPQGRHQARPFSGRDWSARAGIGP